MLVLGAVQEVRDLEVSVSLPCNMCGTVAIGNVSDPLTEGVVEELEEEEEREKEVREMGCAWFECVVLLFTYRHIQYCAECFFPAS